MRIIFVRRGEFSTYNVLTDSLMAVTDVDVRWDRRRGEDRRAARTLETPREADRRKEGRRKPPTRDWHLHGYTVVDFPDATT